MELFDLLRQDHRKVLQMFDQLETLKDDPEKNRQTMEKVFSNLKKELKTHMIGEERHFYPALRDSEETHELVMESVEEHHVVKVLLREMERIQVNEKWVAKLSVMQENVKHHLQEEEEEIFQKAERLLDREKNREISEQISKMRH